jgi:hypothetical protein
MSNNLIDNIFDYDSYRYVSEPLKTEWKSLYNLYSGDYFNKQHKIYSIYPQNRIDFYNEELERLNRIEKIYRKFNCTLDSLQPKYNSDLEYSKNIKRSLKKSVSIIHTFVQNKKNLVLQKFEKNNIPKIKDVEEFNQCYDLDDASNNKIPIIITLFLILLIFYISLYYE